MRQCPNCGIVIGGVYEKVLHSYNGLTICGFCVETLEDRGWLCRASQGYLEDRLHGDRGALAISFMDGSQYTVPVGKFKPGDLTWQQLKQRLAQYRD